MNATPRAAPELPPVLTTEDVAAALHISVAHARRLAAAGEIPARRRGRRWYVLRDEFEQVLRPHGADGRRAAAGVPSAARHAEESTDAPTA